MFERLLELFFHAKAGAFAGLILIGTTGALVTATVSSSNGVTTITLTQASASPSGSASPSHSPSASPTRSASPSPATSPSSSPATAAAVTTACTDETHAVSDAVKTVNAAFSKYHNDLMHMRSDSKSDAAKKIVEDTDKLLKSLRQNAVKDIHATSACAKADDDDEDADEDRDEDNDDEDEDSEKSSKKTSESNFVVALFNNLFGRNTTTTTTTTNNTTVTTTTTSGDPKTIADTAVAAMKLAFDNAVTQLHALPSPSPRASKSPKTTVHADRSGKGNGSHERDDDEDDD